MRADVAAPEPARSPVKVAFVLHVMQVAGAEVLVMETIRRLGPAIVPTVFCLDAIGPLGEQLRAEGVAVLSFDRRPGLDWGVFGRMAREIRSRGIDVIHAHQYTPFFYSSVAAILSGRRPRVIFTEHGRHYPDVVSAKRRWANRLVFNRLADEITAVCAWSKQALAEKDGFSLDRISVIPNGIDLSRYPANADRREIARRVGLDPDRRRIVIVARFHPVKDHRTLVTAFQTVAAARSDVDLVLVGDGPLRSAIEQQVAQAGLVSRVIFAGVRRDVPDWLLASDIFTLTSVSEAASITLLEAMACGRASVVTAVGGNPELVRDGVDGLLVPRGDAPGFARAFLRLLDAPDLLESMGRSARARVESEFLLETTVSRYAALYGN
jgi:glycosyltransferase involved in cell wall biosynthesis